jgi:hypothetical protein
VKRIGTSLVVIIALFIFFLTIILTYASVWGENNKANSAINRFFENIQEQNYFSQKSNLQIVESFKVFDTGGDYSENCFLLELALLKNYNLTKTSGYKVKIQKSNFWIPFISKPDIKVDITLKNVANGYLSSIVNNSKSAKPIKNLFTVSRKDGTWKITSINLKNSPLISEFKRLKTGLSVDRFVTRVGTKIIVQPFEIESKNISTIEKRKLEYVFQKINYEIKQSTTQEQQL